MREVIAVAECAADEQAVERLLDRVGIEYDIALDAAEPGDAHRVCFLGRSYAVDSDSAERSRQLLRDAGLGGLIIGSQAAEPSQGQHS